MRRQPNDNTSQDDIAIIGMASLFAHAPDLASLWRNVLEQIDGTDQPPDAWAPARYLDSKGNSSDRLYTTAGGFLGDLYRFDPLTHGIMPSSLDGQEPDQFIALRVARDALADAGYADRSFDRSRTGVILGHSTYLNRAQANAVQFGVVLDQTLELLQGLHPGLGSEGKERIRELLKSKLAPFTADTGPGLVPNVMTGRIANRLDLAGPNYLIDAACASSLLSVHSAVEELRTGRSDMMLAGGVNASTPAEAFLVFCQLGALSRSSRIRPFDAKADGTLLGEGAGVIVLKRYSDAIRDGNRVYAVVRGVGQSSDGRGAGLLAPRMEGEVLALNRGYREAGVSPNSISLLEAHGTGIPLGDRTEVQALRTVFGERVAGDFPHCAMGSVKSNICHCIPAAGVAGIIKASLALYYKILPPTLCETVNPGLELDRTPFYINTAARPWIHSNTGPRRAGVNAFGFGGVNAHCVLEEGPREPVKSQPRLDYWKSELVVLSAEDRNTLQVRIEWVMKQLDTSDGSEINSEVSFADVAKTLVAEDSGAKQRLAVVATGLRDLYDKLRQARDLLTRDERSRFQTRSGIYFSAKPLDGRLAFMFPGEGAQYTHMLADLAMSFPLVRQWFDMWDTIFEEDRLLRPSSIVFPPPTGIDHERRDYAEKLLHGLELGSESVFIASQALLELLRRFGLEADAVVGHSSGENSALVAAGVLDLGTGEYLREHITRLNGMYREMETAGKVARGKLLTVGAVDRERIMELVEASEGQLYLALDNCRHQAVLYGSEEVIETVSARLRSEGALCSLLPFDRAYHTPEFAPVARLIDRFYDDISFSSPTLPIYSCATTDRFPDEPSEIRRLTVIQWQSRVRFTETVQRLYREGFRHFVEVGPASNLTNFVNDILRGEDHLAVPVDSRKRSGVTQIQHLLGRLFVAGRQPRLDYLFADRGCRIIDLETLKTPEQRAPFLDNTLPYVRLDPHELEEAAGLLGLSGEHHEGQGAEASPSTSTSGESLADRIADAETTSETAEVDDEHSSTAASDTWVEIAAGPSDLAGAERNTALGDYLKTMQAFLRHQERVMSAAFCEPVESATNGVGLPMVHHVIKQEEGRAEVECDFDLEQTFLRHHTLYAHQVSERDPDLTALPVVPLTVSLELLAETASLVARSDQVVALERVRAFNWVALDIGYKTVRARAVRLEPRTVDPAGGIRVAAALYEEEQLLLECEVVLEAAQSFLPPPLPPLTAPVAPVWRDTDLYTRGMFHGPLFHSVKALLAWDGGGVDVELNATPTSGFFYPRETPEFLINPILLDAVGHVAAFWVAQQQGTDFSSFPSRIERIAFAEPHRQDTNGCFLRGRLAFLGGGGREPRFLEGDYECVDAEERPLFRIEGWRDRFFSVPNRFYLARSHPREAWLGEDWSSLVETPVGHPVLIWSMPGFERGFLEDAGGVWRRLLVHTFLSAEERIEWNRMRVSPPRLTAWLMARIALKEAVRFWLCQRTGQLMFPADILIDDHSSGRTYVRFHGLEDLIQVPEISVSHTGNDILAAVSEPGNGIGIDAEAIGGVQLDDLLQSTFTPTERQWLADLGDEAREDIALAMWCSKEAVGKRLGQGLGTGPQTLAVSSMEPKPPAFPRQVSVMVRNQRLTASVARRQKLIVALCVD